MTDCDAEALARKHGWGLLIHADGPPTSEAIAAIREAYAAGLAAAWRDMKSAPRDGTAIVILTRGGSVVRANWADDVAISYHGDDETPVGTWIAEFVGEHPPSWTEGAYWKVNDDGEESDPPVAWVPLPTADTRQADRAAPKDG